MPAEVPPAAKDRVLTAKDGSRWFICSGGRATRLPDKPAKPKLEKGR